MKGLSFTPENILKVLDGTKTQTRRFPRYRKNGEPYCIYKEGDIVYAKEVFRCVGNGSMNYNHYNTFEYRSDMGQADIECTMDQYYKEDNILDEYPSTNCPWRSPMFMPEYASRQKLLIVNVKPLERVLNISADDAIAEGIDKYLTKEEPVEAANSAIIKARFFSLWESIYKGDPEKCVAANPLVYPITFERIEE